jgi:hypothetical protein
MRATSIDGVDDVGERVEAERCEQDERLHDGVDDRDEEDEEHLRERAADRYWARIEQREAAAEHAHAFAHRDGRAGEAAAQVGHDDVRDPEQLEAEHPEELDDDKLDVEGGILGDGGAERLDDHHGGLLRDLHHGLEVGARDRVEHEDLDDEEGEVALHDALLRRGRRDATLEAREQPDERVHHAQQSDEQQRCELVQIVGQPYIVAQQLAHSGRAARQRGRACAGRHKRRQHAP